MIYFQIQQDTGILSQNQALLSFMSLLLWEAQRVIGVADVEAGKLNCDRVSRFYRPPASGRRIKLFIHVFMGGLNCNRGR